MAHSHHHLTTDNVLYDTVWLDAMHDRMNYKATNATTDDDLLMTWYRQWPTTLTVLQQPQSFLQLFKNKYILETKNNVINAGKNLIAGIRGDELVPSANPIDQPHATTSQNMVPKPININQMHSDSLGEASGEVSIIK